MAIITHKSGLSVDIRESQNKNGSIKLKAYIVDPDSHERLSKPETCTVKASEDKETWKTGLVNRICADWSKRNRANAGKSERAGTVESSIVRDAFSQLDFSSGYFTERWGAESTRRNAAVFFQRNTIPFIENFLDKPCTRADVEDLFHLWEHKASENGHSSKVSSQTRRTVNTHLFEAGFIYAAMRAIHSDLPEIDFSGFSTGRNVQSEKAKSLPESVRKRLTVYLENHVTSHPKEVRGTVLMFDTALRTAEAAAQLPRDILFYDNFAVVNVRFQEKDGERCELLKTDAAYRNVTTSFWGKALMMKCNDLLNDGDADTPSLTARQLRAWIQQALLACGLDDEYFQAARKLMDEEPDRFSDGTKDTDIIAYILRKDRASRWINVCGLSCLDTDYLLGHKIDLPSAQLPNFKTIENHQKVSQLIENYVYNPAITAHPFFSPLLMRAGDARNLQPAVAVSLCYSGSGKGKMSVTFAAREVGSTIEVRVPKGCKPHVSMQVLPRRELRDQPIIGSQPIQYVDNDSRKESDNL